MARVSEAWGIDIGTTCLKVVGLRVGDGQEPATVTGAWLIPWAAPDNHADGDQQGGNVRKARKQTVLLSTDRDERSRMITAAIESLNHDGRLDNAPISVSFPDDRCLQKLIGIPYCDESELADTVRQLAFARVPLQENSAVWAFQPLLGVGSAGGVPTEAAVFMARRDEWKPWVGAFSRAEQAVEALQPASVGVHNAWRAQWDQTFDPNVTARTSRELLLDIGVGQSTLIASGPGYYQARTFPIGGERFTEQLTLCFDWSREKAERVKRHLCAEENARELITVMRVVYEELLDEVNRSISVFASSGVKTDFARLVLTGGGSRLAGLDRFLEQQMKIEVTPLKNFSFLKSMGKHAEHSDRLATAVGLALHGCGLADITASIMQESVVSRTLKALVPSFLRSGP